MIIRVPLFCLVSSFTEAFVLSRSVSFPKSFKNKVTVPSRNPLTNSLSMSTESSKSNVGLGDIHNQKFSEEISHNQDTEDNEDWCKKIETSIAKSRRVRGGNFVQIATCDNETNEPRCRTVVFRGFLKSSSGVISTTMKMITDSRSRKYTEISKGESKIAELLWWFSKSNEQYRIRGEIKFVGNSEVDEYLLRCRKEQWGNLSDSAREQFFWREPGASFERELIVPEGGRNEERKVLPPPDNFLLMLLNPTRCDYLSLSDNFRQIDTLQVDKWSTERVNP